MQSEFPLQFANYQENITNEQLNGAYGEYGQTYASEIEAKSALMRMGFRPRWGQRNCWYKQDEEAMLTKLRELSLSAPKTHGKQARHYIKNGVLITFKVADARLEHLHYLK